MPRPAAGGRAGFCRAIAGRFPFSTIYRKFFLSSLDWTSRFFLPCLHVADGGFCLTCGGGGGVISERQRRRPLRPSAGEGGRRGKDTVT